MKVFLIGAGASRGSVGHLEVPVAKDFGRVLTEICPCWETQYPDIRAVIQHLDLEENDWPLERVWSCIDWYAKLQPALPLPKPWHNESPQLKKALLSVYGERCDKASMEVRECSTLFRMLSDEVESGDVVVSFNYDTITERVAKRADRRLAMTPHGSDDIVFAKPHGSASWILDLNSGRLEWSSHALPLVDSLPTSEVRCGKEPLLLGAVPIKSELIREVQVCGGTQTVFTVVAAQWRKVVEAIRDCNTLVAVGYSFPPEDQYGRFLFQEGWRLRQGKGPRIEFYERKERACQFKSNICDIFGAHVQTVVYRGPVLPEGALDSHFECKT